GLDDTAQAGRRRFTWNREFLPMLDSPPSRLPMPPPPLRRRTRPPAGFVPWGEMTIEEPERPLRVASPRSGFCAIEEGARLRCVHRLLTVRRVFAVRRGGRSPAVLVDWSGSMGLQETDVEGILRRAPRCTLAVYSGDLTKGVLRVLAKDGRRVRPEDV